VRGGKIRERTAGERESQREPNEEDRSANRQGSAAGGWRAAGNRALARVLDGGLAPRPTVDAVDVAPGNGAVARLIDGAAAQRSAAGPVDGATSGPPAGFVSSVAASGTGEELPRTFRSEAESSFEADLSGVRVHRDASAADAAKQVSARAFTIGTDIYFGAGRYDPDSGAGRRLLAHELTHVTQPDSGVAAGSSWLSEPGDATERAADASAERFGTGAPAGPAGHGRATVARAPEAGAATASSPDTGQINYIPVDGRKISRNPDTARQQFIDIAMKEGVKAARWVLIDLRARRSELGLDLPSPFPDYPNTAEANAHEAVISAMEKEDARWKEFEKTFQAAAEDKTEKMLKFSEGRVTEERDKYGLAKTESTYYGELGPQPVEGYSMVDTTSTRALATAARQLVDALGPLQEAQKKLEAIQPAEVPGTYEFDIGSRPEPPDPALLAAAQEEVKLAQERYLLLRHEKELLFPVLASFAGYDFLHTHELKGVRHNLEQIGQGAAGGDATATILGGDVFQKLDNIATVRAALQGHKLDVWAADNLVRYTKMDLGVAPGSLEDRIVDQKVSDDQSEHMLRNIFIGTLAFALGLLAAPLSGGGSLAVAAGVAATAGSTALSGYLAFEHLQEYRLEKAAHGTDFEKANAISSEDPSLFWLALDIVGFAVDIGVAAKAFGNLRGVARQALNASAEDAEKALAELRKAAEAETKNRAVGESVERAARRQREQQLPTDAKLKPHYQGENDPTNERRAFFPKTVEYFTPEEQEAHRVFVDGSGNLRWAKDNSLLDTSKASTVHSGGAGRAIFVMDGHGNLYASLEQQVGRIHHSSLLAGADVVGAGEIEVRNGRLVVMTDQSGHYVPLEEMNDRVVKELVDQGVKLDPRFKKFGWGGQER
jgi:hypothetical protein